LIGSIGIPKWASGDVRAAPRLLNYFDTTA